MNPTKVKLTHVSPETHGEPGYDIVELTFENIDPFCRYHLHKMFEPLVMEFKTPLNFGRTYVESELCLSVSEELFI